MDPLNFRSLLVEYASTAWQQGVRERKPSTVLSVAATASLQRRGSDVPLTGEGLGIFPPSIGWENVVRFHHRDLSIDNLDVVGARVANMLGAPAVQEVLEALERSAEDRAALIGRLYARDDARWLADLLIEIEEDPDDLVRLNLIAALRRGLGG